MGAGARSPPSGCWTLKSYPAVAVWLRACRPCEITQPFPADPSRRPLLGSPDTTSSVDPQSGRHPHHEASLSPGESRRACDVGFLRGSSRQGRQARSTGAISIWPRNASISKGPASLPVLRCLTRHSRWESADVRRPESGWRVRDSIQSCDVACALGVPSTT